MGKWLKVKEIIDFVTNDLSYAYNEIIERPSQKCLWENNFCQMSSHDVPSNQELISHVFEDLSLNIKFPH